MEALILYFWFQSSIWPIRASLIAQMVKNLPAMKETQVQSLGQEDPLEKDMATHSCSITWRIPWPEEPSGLQSIGLQGVRHSWRDLTHVVNYLLFEIFQL